MQFVETEMGSMIDSNMIDLTGGFLSMEMVVKGNFYVEDVNLQFQ